MIITEQKVFSEIADSLKACRKIFLVGCSECSAACHTGGEPEIHKIKQELEKQGKIITGMAVPAAPCVASKIKLEFAKNIPALKETEAILVLACGLGVQSVKDNDRFGLTVLPGCNTLCGAVMDAKGDFYEKCSMCGECVLADTSAVCPVTLCSKGLLNGPCGGMNKGKCEVDRERECAWVTIYKESAKRDKLEDFKKIRAPKDFKKTLKPRKLVASLQ